jgi:hypothetical protein
MLRTSFKSNFTSFYSRALASFKAVDLDNSRNLNVRELKTLLWLCNSEEPTE